jgi:hypothetical protein
MLVGVDVAASESGPVKNALVRKQLGFGSISAASPFAACILLVGE